MAAQTIGVLVMSYGTPESMEQVEAYYTHIRRGRPPQPEQLEDLVSRYEAIGGLFPLRRNTNEQVEHLQTRLDQLTEQSDLRFQCYQGLRHAPPLIEEGVEEMAKAGITEAIALVLAPHYSTMSVGAYIQRARQAATEKGIRLTCITSYHRHPLLIEAWADRVSQTLNQFEPEVRGKVHILYSAHSLPEKILEQNDPYVDQLTATCQAVMDELKIDNPWQLTWQSESQSGQPWLGPDILDVLKTLKDEGTSHVLVCPVGFVSDHLETMYDLDIEAKEEADRLGLQFRRTPALNSDPRYISLLADLIIRAYKGELTDVISESRAQ